MTVSANIPAAAGTPVPMVWSVPIPLAQFSAAGQYVVPLGGARHVHVDNRTARQLLVQLSTTAQAAALWYVVDDNSSLSVTVVFDIVAVTLVDIAAANNSPAAPLPLHAGMREGLRNDDQLPYQGAANPFGGPAVGMLPASGGYVLVTASTIAVEAQRAYRPIVPKINWAVGALSATGSEQITIDGTSLRSNADIVAAGYYQAIQAINPTASSFIVATVPVNGTPARGDDNIVTTIPANSSIYLPMEFASCLVEFSAAGQQIICYCAVTFAASGAL